MKRNIIEALQVAAAIIITGSFVYAMQPTEEIVEPQANIASEAAQNETLEQEQTTVEENAQEAEQAPEPAPEPELTLEQKITQNVNNCNPTRISAEDASCLPDLVETPQVNSAIDQPVTGDWVQYCHGLAAQIGITLDSDAITLIDRESDCNPHILYGGTIDANYTGDLACGIPQALPCNKLPGGGTMTSPTAQLQWMHDYVMGVYGSWNAALAHSLLHNWY